MPKVKDYAIASQKGFSSLLWLFFTAIVPCFTTVMKTTKTTVIETDHYHCQSSRFAREYRLSWCLSSVWTVWVLVVVASIAFCQVATSAQGLSTQGSPQQTKRNVAQPTALPGVRVLESSASHLLLEYQPQVIGVDTVQRSPLVILPRIAGARPVATSVGEPYRLEMTIPLAVLSPTAAHLQEIQALSVRQFQALMASKPSLKRVAVGSEHIAQESVVASPSANSPNYRAHPLPAWQTLSYAGQSRSQHLVHLTLRAARYNAASGMVEIPTVLRVRVSFDDAAQSPAQSPVSRQEWQRDLETSAVLNTAQAQDWYNNSTKRSASFSLLSSTPLLSQTVPNAASANVEGKRQSGVQETSGRWYRIEIQDEGIYRIDAQQLASAGISISRQEWSSIRIFGLGGMELPEQPTASEFNQMIEQSVLLDTTTDGRLNALIFYGASCDGWRHDGITIRHFINTYSYVSQTRKTNVYLLNIGGGQRSPAAFATAPAEPASFRPTSYTARVFWEEEAINPYPLGGSGRRWFGTRIINGSSWTQTTPLPNIVRNGTVLYRIAAGYYNTNGDGQSGVLTVSESRTPLDTFRLPYTGDEYRVAFVDTQEKRVAASSLSDRSSLQFTFRGNSGGDEGVVDWFEIHYPREFVALNNNLEFFTEHPDPDFPTGVPIVAEYSASGFSGQIYIVDATDRARPVFVRNQAMTSGVAMFKTEFMVNRPKRFWITGQTRTPTRIIPTDVAGLRTTSANADVIIVTHKDLLGSAQEFATYRRNHSDLGTTVVTTEQIFNEFSSGLPDATAIRDFVAFAYRTWTRKPRYLVLWGDGHFDHRNIRTNERIYVPTYQSLEGDGIFDAVNNNVMTEDYFVTFVGNDRLVDMAMGRIPAKILANGDDEGRIYLEKLRRYENGSANDLWRTRVVLVADDSPTSKGSDGVRHTFDSEILARRDVPPDLVQRKIYLPDFPAEVDITNRTGGRQRPSVNAEIITSINNGALIVNWIGHGSPNLWAHEQVFTNESINQLTNRDKLFFLTAATCDYSRFDRPDNACGPELMLFSRRGGIIGAFAATRVVYATENAEINEFFYQNLFLRLRNGSTRALGDVMFAVKQIYNRQNDVKYCLLGDPTLRLLIPQQRLMIQSVNGRPLNDTSTVQFKALETLEITGSVLGLTMQTDTVDTGFAGNVLLSLYDSDVVRRPVDVDGSQHTFTVLGGLLNFGSAQVRNGRFTVRMTVPKDISFSNQAGRLFGYASDAQGRRMARGSSSQFTLGGTDETAIDDGRGPDISIFMDNRRFKAGDYVGTNATLIVDLFDQTGINATGLGIGHDIQCWFDNNPLPVNLTSFFTSSIEDARRGSVERRFLNLASGRRRVRVRAWDVFNNFSEAETWFRVGRMEDGTMIAETMNYPNPFAEQTTIQIRHSQLDAVPMTIEIYALSGKRVRALQTTANARTMEVLWDGRDDNGIQTETGMYIYRVTLSNPDGSRTSSTGKMMHVR